MYAGKTIAVSTIRREQAKFKFLTLTTAAVTWCLNGHKRAGFRVAV